VDPSSPREKERSAVGPSSPREKRALPSPRAGEKRQRRRVGDEEGRARQAVGAPSRQIDETCFCGDGFSGPRGELTGEGAWGVTPCGHAFHLKCLSRWLRQCTLTGNGPRPSCPYCKRGFDSSSARRLLGLEGLAQATAAPRAASGKTPCAVSKLFDSYGWQVAVKRGESGTAVELETQVEQSRRRQEPAGTLLPDFVFVGAAAVVAAAVAVVGLQLLTVLVAVTVFPA